MKGAAFGAHGRFGGLPARVPLAAALVASLLAFSRSLASDVGLVLAVAAAATVFVGVRLDSSLERLARLISRFAVVVAALAGWVLAVAPMLHGERTDDVLRTIGFVLAACALPLAAREPRADAAVILCALGLFGVAGLHRLVPIGPFVMVGGVAAAAHAVVAVRAAARTQAVGSGGPRSLGGLARLVASLAIATAVASGLVWGLPPLQRRVEQALFRGRVQILDARSGLSTEDVRVGDVSRLAGSDRPVLRVFSTRAQRLRAQLFLRFDGRGWHAVHATVPVEARETDAVAGPYAAPLLARMGGPLRVLPGVEPSALEGEQVLASRIEPIELDDGLMLSPGATLAVKSEEDLRVDSLGLLVRSERRAPDPYVVVHGRRLGIGDPQAPPPSVRALALSLPREVDPRLRALADRLARADGAPVDAPMLPARQRIERTTAFVRGAARYALDTPRYTSRDVVAELLFDKRVGWCEHFSTALAVLLRLEGVPSRYVTGFQVDESDREGEHYLVRDDNAHAWVEAFVEGEGWIEADATPAGEGAPTHPARRGGLFAWLRAAWADLRAALRFGRAADVLRNAKWPVAIGFSLLGLAYVARNEVRRRRSEARGGRKQRPRDPLVPELEACLRDVDGAFRRAGHPRPRSAGLLEHATRAEAAGLTSELGSAIRAAIEPLHRAAFGGEPPAVDELRRARARLRAARS
jgi:transglutaminase-like putative cysteine protease